MIYLIISLIFLLLAFFYYSFKNKYALCLSTIIISILGILYASLNLILTSNSYDQGHYLFNINEYSLLRRLALSNAMGSTINIHIYNVSIAVFLFSMIIFSCLYYKNPRDFKRVNLIWLMFPLLYIWFYSPNTSYQLYCLIWGETGSFFKPLICAVDALMYIGIFVYMLFPLVNAIKSTQAPKNHISQKRNVLVLFCLIVCDIYFLIIIFLGMFRVPYIFNDNVISVRYLQNTAPRDVYAGISVCTLMIVILLIVLVNKYSMSARLGFIKQIVFRHNIKKLHQNYINIFHSFKNIVLSYKLMLEHTHDFSAEDKEKAIYALEEKMDAYVKQIALMLDIEDNNLEYEIDVCNLKNIVSEAIDDFSEYKVEIAKSIDKDLIIDADSYYIKEVLNNLIKNAIEAIEHTDRKGKITIEGTNDGEWNILKITDNGIGMTKQEISNLFKMFYTTKSRFTNWGVGLSHSYKIIHLHGGYISVESKPSEGTSFYIYLPVYNAKKRRFLDD